MKARVFITPKKGVLDPQGRAIADALKTLGFSHVQDARQGKVIEIHLEAVDKETAHTMLTDMCEKLLANTVIEDYSFEVL